MSISRLPGYPPNELSKGIDRLNYSPPDNIGSTMCGLRSGSPQGLEASSGVGLAFCKAAVEANGGRIWCETTEGQGASFYFTVPRAKPSEARGGVKRRLEAPAKLVAP